MGFVKKIGLYFVGNMASKLMTALLIPIYAFYISSSDLGAFDYSQTIMQIAVPIIYMAIWEAILKYVISCKDAETRNIYIGTALKVSFISTVTLFFLLLFLYKVLSLKYPLAVYLMMLSYAYGVILQYCSRSLGENTTYVFSGIFATIINFVSILVLVVILKKGLMGLYVSYILGQAGSCCVSVCKLKLWTKVSYSCFDKTAVKTLLYFSIPMAVNSSAGWLINGVGRVIINFKLGDAANGLYSYASKFGNLVTIITSVISMALMEEFYIRMNDIAIKNYFQEKCNQIWMLILSVFSFVIPLIGFYFLWIRSTEYYSSLKYVPLCIMSACLSAFATNVGGVFQIKNIMQYAFLTTLAGGLVTTVFSYVMIERYSVFGVVIAQLLGSFVLLITRIAVAKKVMDYTMEYLQTATMLFLLCIDSMFLMAIKSYVAESVFMMINTLILALFHEKRIRLMLRERRERKNAKGE